MQKVGDGRDWVGCGGMVVGAERAIDRVGGRLDAPGRANSGCDPFQARCQYPDTAAV